MRCWNSVSPWPDYPLMLEQWLKSFHYWRGCTRCAGPGPGQSCEISGFCCSSNSAVEVRCPSAPSWVSQATLGSFCYGLCWIVCSSDSGKVWELKRGERAVCGDTSPFSEAEALATKALWGAVHGAEAWITYFAFCFWKSQSELLSLRSQLFKGKSWEF